MTPEHELWACAVEMIRQHGEEAAIHAATRADELLANGDIDGARTWEAIVRRLNQLEAPAGTAH